jgi:hypothetical protein
MHSTRPSRRDTAALVADVDLDQHVQPPAVGRRGPVDGHDVVGIVGADPDARLAGERRQPGQSIRRSALLDFRPCFPLT